ncbi:unnamed protein product [Enterobius vermicularis]|uniref:SH3 domain-containing protein n=1 Tax=Enterobius vermicularis TaxID=51028 RepID=A0A0N4V9D5_ENTVE|nr:unnamed protein product [Enterobius vermicularis]
MVVDYRSDNNGDAVAEDNKFLVISDLPAADENDLSITSGEVLSIIATRPDGWWLAKNVNGKRGLVPKTFLKLISSSDPNPELREQEVLSNGSHLMSESVSNATGVGSLPDAVEEADVLQNTPRQLTSSNGSEEEPRTSTAAAPHSTYATRTSQLNAYTSMNRPSTVHRTPNYNVNSVIILLFFNDIFLAALVSYFQTEQPQQVEWSRGGLGAALENDIHLTCQCHLAPRLSESNLGFHDVYWNHDSNKLRKRRVRVSKIIRLIKLEKVFSDAPNVQIRLIRACLFDFSGKTGKQIVSNVHTVKADDKNEKNWTFSNRTCGGQTGLEFSEFFVRSNYTNPNVVLMMETSVLCPNNDGRLEEEPKGYFVIPIVDHNGRCILENK